MRAQSCVFVQVCLCVSAYVCGVRRHPFVAKRAYLLANEAHLTAKEPAYLSKETYGHQKKGGGKET
jgi:hypothetical protein